MARAVANQLGKRVGSTIIVENRTGASGMIGASAVAKGPKDGSQILFSSISIFSTAATTRNVPFDVTKDLVPVAFVYEAPMVVAVSAKNEIKTPQDLISAARVKPGRLTHGTGGVGTIAHLAAELLNDAARIELTHVPYKGAALVVPDVISGNVDMMIAVASNFSAQIAAGRMRPIAVTSATPSSAFPGLPTMASAAPGFSVLLWTAVFAPAGTPPAIVQRLNREINEISKSKEVLEIMNADGATPVALSPEEASRRALDSYATWKRLATSRNIVLE